MPRKTDSNNPADWIWIAEADHSTIELLAYRDENYYLCRAKLAEVIEKNLKAELIRTGWSLRKTHDLRGQAKELRDRDAELGERFEDLVNDYASAYLETRYPGFDLDDPDWPSLRADIVKAGELLRLVKARIG